jgi:hypothetical protein
MKVFAILFAVFFIVLGGIIVYGTYKRWPGLVDPPENWSLFYSQAFLKKWLGQKFLIMYTYFLGILFIGFACFGLWNGLAK